MKNQTKNTVLLSSLLEDGKIKKGLKTEIYQNGLPVYCHEYYGVLNVVGRGYSVIALENNNLIISDLYIDIDLEIDIDINVEVKKDVYLHNVSKINKEKIALLIDTEKNNIQEDGFAHYKIIDSLKSYFIVCGYEYYIDSLYYGTKIPYLFYYTKNKEQNNRLCYHNEYILEIKELGIELNPYKKIIVNNREITNSDYSGAKELFEIVIKELNL